MAQLLRKNSDADFEVFVLNLGANSIGSGSQNHFVISHPSVANHHCNVILSATGLQLENSKATNQTFVDGKKVVKTRLKAGQTLRLGEVDFLVESTEVTIRIIEIQPVSKLMEETNSSDSETHCPRHPNRNYTHRCTQCNTLLCDECVSRIRREGGVPLLICNRCSQTAEPLSLEDSKLNKRLVCLRHPNAKAVFRCEKCNVALCNECVIGLRQPNGKTRLFCAKCNQPVKSFDAPKPKEKSLFQKLNAAIKAPLGSTKK